ncbi:MAG: hypothetical protein Ta2B_22880 [Termitinemataceae bacterium]|nr:MAG: hypothetical protein Ta2B_22880 [Termitinemataceae bacterium]
MKKTIKLLCCFAAISIFFAACGENATETGDIPQKDDTGGPNAMQVYSLNSNGTFTETGTVCVLLENKDEDADPEYLQVGTIVNGIMKFSFPSGIDGDYLINLAGEDAFGGFTCDPEEIPAFVSDLFFLKAGEDTPSGIIINANATYMKSIGASSSSSGTRSVKADLIYSTANAEVTGTYDGVVASIELEGGWDWLYTEKTSYEDWTMSSTSPGAMMFAYQPLED